MKNKKSTSILENINGDKKLNIFEQIYWIFICIVNYFFSLFIITDQRIEKIKFAKFTTSKLLNKNSSPARMLSDIFWITFPWTEFKKKTKRKFSIVEVGCGDGRYGDLLKKIFNQNFKNYLGIDINPRKKWKSKKKYMSFVKSDCYNIGKYLKNKNLIITQSAVEHFKYDLEFFKNIKKKLPTKKEVIQIHIFPSYGCLFTYLFHGYRHYNLNSISKITKIFDKNCHFKLFYLGSSSLNWFHFKNITLQKTKMFKLLNMNSGSYFIKLKQLILKSNRSKKISSPSFYALVIFNNFKKNKI